ncbi:DUF924 family protein [Leucothrix pacifica]|uniref:DUF924 domain-containing protein n=1 Tax=Leucothrix pacifica TaxID=1247513 RepID=A0A317C8L3_9GAMM|nr:DUF924 family protein [Leucothrix pacifica]PWQ94934.1 DUF924 domain-containing protein [Leucothrix pacifica]
MHSPDDILKFWYSEPMKSHWFKSTPEIDALITEKYEFIWQTAANGDLDIWQDSPEGCLALCIILDQFPLNMFRGQALAFSTEQHAVTVAKHAIVQDYDKQLDKSHLSFLYMPLMHSENLDDQDLAIACFEAAGLDDNVRFAHHHRGIIETFGRFPHRNEILGRESSENEIAYLNSKSAFKG